MESDSIGNIDVDTDVYWGAQTQRSFTNFEIGDDAEKMPIAVIKAMAILKKAAAKVNKTYGLDASVADTIVKVADEVRARRTHNRSSKANSTIISPSSSGKQDPVLKPT